MVAIGMLISDVSPLRTRYSGRMTSVQNLPGVDDRRMDELIALKAACNLEVPREFADISLLVREFKLWLGQASDDADRLYRRFVLLTVTDGNVADRDAATLRKAIDDIYRGI